MTSANSSHRQSPQGLLIFWYRFHTFEKRYRWPIYIYLVRWFSKKYFLRVADMVKIILAFYLTCFLAYTLTFYLTFYLVSILTYFLANILTFLSGILSGISSSIHSGIHSGILSSIYSDILSAILSDILRGICSSILSRIVFDILPGVWLTSCSAHWNLELAVGVWQCPLTSRLRSGSAH